VDVVIHYDETEDATEDALSSSDHFEDDVAFMGCEGRLIPPQPPRKEQVPRRVAEVLWASARSWWKHPARSGRCVR